MAFFDDFGKKLGAAVDTTVAKTKEFTDITKLNMQISSEERKIEKLYAEIGKLVFETEKEKPDSFIAEQCLKITDLKKTIENLEQELEKTKK